MDALSGGLGQVANDAMVWGALVVLARGTAVLVGAALVCVLLRRASSASRHMVWTLAFGALLALPALTVFVPWEVRVLPAWPGIERVSEGNAAAWAEAGPSLGILPAVTDLAPPPVEALPVAAPSSALVPGLPAPAAHAPVLAPVAGPRDVARQSAGRVADALLLEPFAGTRDVLRRVAAAISPWVVGVWLAGAGLLFARFIIGFMTVRVLGFRAETLDDVEWRRRVDRLARQCGVRRRVRLVRSDLAAMPMTWGVLEPVILLPVSSSAWSEERKELVLLHELAHVRRRDVLAQAVAQAACAFYWFNPLVWLAAARMRAECERACDDWVLRAGTRASTYADHLLELVRSVGRSSLPTPALPMARRRGFEGRLLAILEPGVRRERVSRLVSAAGGALALALTLMVSALAPADPVAAAGKGSPVFAAIALDRGVQVSRPAHPAPPAHAVHSSSGSADGVMDWGAIASQAVVDQEPQQQGSAATAALVGALSDADDGVRSAAARALGDLGDPRAVAALSETLRRDTVAEVRRTAAWALGEIEDSTAVPALSQALRDDADLEVRRTSVWALGQIEHESSVSGLVIALGDADAEIRRNAVWALGEIESEAAVDPLLPLLQDADVETRRQAIWALGQIESPRAVPGLIAVLSNDTDVEARKQAAWALGQIEDPSAVPGLEAALGDANLEMRKTAIWALTQIEPETAPQALIDALKDVDATVRATAANALGEIEDPAAASALAAAIEDTVAEVRRAALYALSSMGDVRAVDALVRLLQDPDPEVRKAAARALGRSR